ncbi:MAG: acyltransferase [Desmonostoc vinosum HA7617-LM4]|jgi:acetyltransferase-like isoleucine patch superfamily enzyme|nr:acyltransferase [Desmonostoc vinosum HA7617-LM4]
MNNFFVAVLVALLPSWIKILVLRMMGHEIGKDVYIGMSILNIRKITLKDGARIQNLNYFKNLSHLTMMERSAISGWGNWFTASQANYQDNEDFGCLTIGERASITGRHYFDVQGRIVIGKGTLIGGFNSTFYTHTITADIDTTNINKPIIIGERCYVGSHCIFLPGTAIGSFTFVGAGSVVTKNFLDKDYVLLAGNPAMVKKVYPKESKFFTEHFKKMLQKT